MGIVIKKGVIPFFYFNILVLIIKLHAGTHSLKIKTSYTLWKTYLLNQQSLVQKYYLM